MTKLALLLAASLALPLGAQNITTIAGGGPRNLAGASTGIPNPAGVAVDPSGNVFVALTTNHQVYKITTAGVVNVYAGTGGLGPYNGESSTPTSITLGLPSGLAFDLAGNLYIADASQQRIRRITPAGVTSTVAGNGSAGFSGDTGMATSASLNGPSGIAVDSSNNIFIADTLNNRVRMVNGATGVITTIAGNGTAGYTTDFPTPIAGPSAALNRPVGIAFDSAGSVYVADFNNQRVRKITTPASSPTITTFAGNGSVGFSTTPVPATSSGLNNVVNVAVDAGNNVFIVEAFDIRQVANGSSNLTLVAGTGNLGFSGDGTFSPTSATFRNITGLGLDATASNLYIADAANGRIRRIVTSSGAVSTLAGNGSLNFTGDGGLAVNANLFTPSTPVIDNTGNLLFADVGGYSIRKVTLSSNILSTVAGNGQTAVTADGQPATSPLNGVYGLATDSSGNFYFTETGRIRKVSGGVLSTVAAGTTFSNPAGLAVAPNGNIYIADAAAHTVLLYNAQSSAVTTIAGNGIGGYSGDGGMAFNAALNGPSALVLDSANNRLFIADVRNNRVRAVDLATNTISTFAGNGTTTFSDNVAPTATGLNSPIDLKLDGAGNLFIADEQHFRVRKVSGGLITTVAGNGTQDVTGDGGPALAAAVQPHGIALGATGTLYIADASGRIRSVPSIGTASTPSVYIDSPVVGASTAGQLVVSGWALNSRTTIGPAIGTVQVLVDGVLAGNATYGGSRSDVCSAYPGRAGCPNVGFTYLLNATSLAAGAHTITVAATDTSSPAQVGSATVVFNKIASPPSVYIDGPAANATVSGTVTVSGWALDNASSIGTAIGSVQILVDGVVSGTATYGGSRPDVCTVYPGRAGCPNVGFVYSLNTTGLTPGSHTITARATDTDPTPDSGTFSVAVNVLAAVPSVYIDAPAAGSVNSGIISVAGWAIDSRTSVGTAIGSVQVLVDGVVVGNATYGSNRSDVCVAYPGRPGCPNVGFTYALDTNALAAGTHTITVSATDTDTTADTGSASVTITTSAGLPSVYIDSPVAGTAASGIINVNGWAIDNRTSVGTAISSVKIYLDGVLSGTATYGSNRADVCSAYPGRPACPNVGFTYALNTAGLSAGSHNITVIATDTDTTPQSGSATTSITIAAASNAPSVYIDAPSAGSAASGVITVSGWALDNRNALGTSIANVQIFVDGALAGNATYGSNRGDVCSTFPGRPGCPNVGFTFTLNTGVYSAGQHTITAVATDTDGTPQTGSFSTTLTFSGAPPPAVYIDSPAAGSTVSGNTAIIGWAIDNVSGIGTAISTVQVMVDGVPVGNATYGASRPDVCSAYPGRPGCPNVGFLYTLNTAGLSPGSHVITVAATDSDAPPVTGSMSVTVVK